MMMTTFTKRAKSQKPKKKRKWSQEGQKDGVQDITKILCLGLSIYLFYFIQRKYYF